jgi:hypothetical protein
MSPLSTEAEIIDAIDQVVGFNQPSVLGNFGQEP